MINLTIKETEIKEHARLQNIAKFVSIFNLNERKKKEKDSQSQWQIKCSYNVYSVTTGR